MAEILIKAIDATNADPAKDARGCYKRGDIVVVMPDGHVWGSEETLPKFYQVKIAGLSVATAQKYLDSARNGETITRRRLYRLAVENLPLAVRNALANTGRYETTLAAVRTYIRNTVTGASE